MPAPTNTTAVLATDLGTLPASVTQTVDFGGTTYSVWYKYTATANETVINVFAFGDLTTYLADLTVYTGPDTAPVAYLGIGARNKPIQMPVTSGVTYYFKIAPSAGNPTPAVLTLTSVTAPTDTAPVGTIVVPDDTDGFPAAFVDSTTGDVLRFVSPFPAGEEGDVASDGHVLVSDATTGEVVWCDAQFNEISRLAFNADDAIRLNPTSDTFYIGHKGTAPAHAVATTVSAGVLGATSWTLGQAGLGCLTASPDDTILYYSGGSGYEVKRWDLINDVALSNLVGTVAGYATSDMLTVSDGSILVLYLKTSGTRDSKVIQYSAAGATVATFTFATAQRSSPTPKLAYDTTTTHFWVWTHHSSPTGVSTFEKVRISDGVIITTLTVPEFETGAYQAAQTATPLADFGISFSCPFFLTRVETPAAATGTIRVVKVIIPSDGTGTFNFSAGGGLSPTTFTLAADGDQQTFNSVAAGSGYSIEETSSPGFTLVSVEVSNDSPADNISVSADETVVVTVTNAASPSPGDLATITDPIRWLRIPPTIFSNGKRVRHTRLQVDMEVGVGLSVASDEQDYNPIILVRSSDDNGKTWSSFRQMNMGRQGQYSYIARLFQLGAAYNRVYEFSGDSPVPFCLVQAFIDLEGWEH